MSRLIKIKLNKDNQEFSKKSAYRSIICCFSGAISVFTLNYDIKLDKNQFAVFLPDTPIHIKSDEAEFLLLEDIVTNMDEPFKVFDDSDNVIINSLSLAYKYQNQENTQALIKSLFDLVEEYIFFISSKRSDSDITETIRNALKNGVCDADFTADGYLKKLPLSKDYAIKLFKKRYGITPHAFLNDERLKKAKILLSGADRFDYSIKNVAQLCGFNDPLYFSRAFKKRYNMSPLKYLHRFDDIKQKKPLAGVYEADILLDSD